MFKEALEQGNRERPNRYPATRSFFEEFRTEFQEKLRIAEHQGNSEQGRRFKEQLEEDTAILAALDRGDVRPAQKSVLSAIEANIRTMRRDQELREAGVDVEKVLKERGIDPKLDESYAQTITRLAGYLRELEQKPLPETEQKNEGFGDSSVRG